MCQFHWELDCVGFSPFEIWRCGCVEMMRGIGGEGFLFHFRVSPEYRRKYVNCLALSCIVAAAAATEAAAAGSAGPAAAVAAACLPTTELLAPQGVAPVSLVGRFTLAVVTVVVVKLASHCVVQQNHSK